MNATKQIPVVTSDAGDQIALQDPNSPASIMKKAKEMEVQSSVDMKYDAQAAKEGFEGCSEKYHEITHALFLATSVLLILYAAAPNQG